MRLDQLQETRILGAERDPFLHALLGLHVLCARLDAQLRSDVEARASAQPEGEPSDETPELALLGVLRLRRLFERYEASFREAASSPDATAALQAHDDVRLPNALLR